jgi:hypothetical protein
MQTLDDIAEGRIREAFERGEFDGLPGAGRPLELVQDPLVPEELRVAYRILRNSGFVPPGVELHREIASVEALLALSPGPDRPAMLRRMEFLRLRLEQAHGGRRNLLLEEQYHAQIAGRLARPDD